MPVMYDGKKFIPAPFITIKKNAERYTGGAIKRILYDITASSKIVAFKGSPDSNGNWWTTTGYPPDETISADSRLTSLRAKQGAICKIFCDEGKWFEIQANDGAAPIKFQPRINDVSFDEGTWFDYFPYSISMQADVIYFGDVACCSATGIINHVDETWNMEQSDEIGRVYRLTHTASCTVINKFDDVSNVKLGWKDARTNVLQHLGFNNDAMVQAGVLNLTGYVPYNHTRSVNQNEGEGTYSVTETWLVFNPSGVVDSYGGIGIPAIEDYTVTNRTSAEDNKITVSIEGNIQGLEIRDTGTLIVTQSRYTSALAKWAAVEPNVLVRAQAVTGVPLNPMASSTQVGRNPTTGVITYSAEYDNRCYYNIAYARAVSVKITNNNPADVFASIPVLARSAGPILQAIGSTTQRERTVSVDIKYPTSLYGTCAIPPVDTAAVSALILSYAPSASQVFVARDEDSYSPTDATYSRTVSFVYQ